MSEMSASEHEVHARLAAREVEVDELRRQVKELEHANKEWREKSNKESMVANEQRMKLSALENQVQSAEYRLNEFKDAVLTVVLELARE